MVLHIAAKSSSVCKCRREISWGIRNRFINLNELNFLDELFPSIPLSKGGNTPLQAPLASPFTQLTYSQKVHLKMQPWYFTGSPVLLSPPPGRACFPLQVNFSLAAFQAGSLLQVGVLSLELAGQPSWGGGGTDSKQLGALEMCY